ncbi:Frag1/DRAM/Sfk1 family protein [Lobosporangium transversale]|uniref:Frag1/DRAM/Sfk1 family protein n=1 Tax=Lobosporangium transversale TaxID=64571 RepID=A0A1Y2GQZ5_9FUNG|nr:Frag1/DRAM/Sfk1 family protein [Lobosporangium transversale]ORZ19936.1 Frag1/DRAM/Sfk1 family protein [Lobosporangium transversale]|eukprot:XP_021882476.1 Frag1/DRAM/Sfk1 family protein [Lobosporangium transversale]
MVNVTDKKGLILARIPGTSVPLAHTIFGGSAFLLALAIGCYGHYYKIVKNGIAGYPDEWFPSVSATTGDWYPERNICQIFIALTSGPRLLLCYLWYLLTVRNVPANGSKGFAKFLFINDFIRTVACGGWVYITSSDDHDIHDIAMILYLLCTVPHVIGTIKTAPQNPQSLRYRKFFAYSFFGALIPMVHFFIQHNVHRIPGAYTYYAFFEWSLIISDLAFDAVCLIDFQTFELRIVDVGLNGKQEDSAKALNGLKTYGGNGGISASLASIKPFEVISFAADVYLGFVFWSMLTALPLMIWYFPLWHMGISGYEAFLFCNLISVLLGINFLRRGIERAKGFVHLLSLIGVLCYKVSDPAHRLMAVAAGSLLSLVAWAATLFGQRHQNGRAERGVLTLALGLILHNVVKMAWWANNPIWPIMNENTGGQNMIGFALGLLASIQVMLRKEPGSDEPKTIKGNYGENWLLAALGSGGYLFCLHSMFTDSTTISRWSLGGYPNTGPQPVPGGMMVIAAMAAGLTLSSKRRWVTSLIWWAIGAAGLAVLHFNEGDIGFAGGIVFTVYALSLFPSIVHSLTRQPPGRTFFVGMLVYNILALAHVWVVAYAFVPGGEVLRERTDYVLIAMQTCILLGVFNSNSSAWDVPLETHARSPFSVARLYSKLTLVGLVLASVGICYKRLPKSSPQPYHPEHKLITAGIWTIHFAIDNDMYNSEIRMRDVIRDLELDVIGLLESDLQRIIMGNRDLTQFLAEDLNMYADYGPGPTKHTWGCSMLSKFPIKRSSHHLLPSPKGELACAIHATLDVYGKEVDVIVSHNGQEEDLLDRQLQTTELGRIMRESDNPFLFLGYVVTRPGQGQEIYELLMDGGHVHDIEVSDWDRWCQYLAFRGVKRVGYARVSHGGITDTEIQVGKYTLLEDHPTSWDKSQSIEEFRKEETYVKIPEDQVPEGLRFPSMFYGAGIRKHRFHVFDRPYYYA